MTHQLTNEQRAAIEALLDAAALAGRNRARLACDIESAINMPPFGAARESGPDGYIRLGMTVTTEMRVPPLPDGMTPEQALMLANWAERCLRRYAGLE